MTLAFGHFSIGVATLILFLFLSELYDHDAAPLIALAGGVWAIIPHLAHALGFTTGVWASAWTNLFVAHHYLDTVIDPYNSRAFAAILVGVMLIQTFALIYTRHRSHQPTPTPPTHTGYPADD